jgi:hypothetical protein
MGGGEPYGATLGLASPEAHNTIKVSSSAALASH